MTDRLQRAFDVIESFKQDPEYCDLIELYGAELIIPEAYDELVAAAEEEYQLLQDEINY